MARRAGVICTLALALAVNANAQTGASGTSTEQSTATTQPPSSPPAAEETRPATTTFFGDTGLWFVPIGEVLPHGKASVSGYRRGTNYLQGFANVGDFAGTFAVGLGNRAELFGSFLVDTRIERDLRPIFINDVNVGGILDRYPQANEGWEGDKLGDFYVGAKINLLSEYRQNGAAVALRGLVKIPTGDTESGASTGKTDFAIDFIASKEAGRKVDIAGFAGYEWRGEADGLDAPTSAFRWGGGLGFPSRSRLRAALEMHGFLPNQDTVTITGAPIIGFDGSVAPVISATQNLTYTTATVTWQGRRGFFIGGGISWNVPMKDRDAYRTDEGAFGDYVDWQVRLGYHPGVRVYVPPPPPTPAPPAPEHVLTVEAECNPCSVEVGKTSTVTATATSSISCAVTYRWSAPSGTFANPTERSTIWTAPNQEGTVPVTVTVTCPSDSKTASDTVNIQVTRPPVKQYAFEDVHFDFDRYSLRPEATRVLDEAIEAMRQDTTLRLTVEGHTCNIGTAEYNLALGDRRSISVRDYIVSRGITADRLNTIMSAPWVDGLTIGQVLAETARRHASREALVFPQSGRRWIWQQFAADVDAAAKGLLAIGIRTGEHVALWATNVPEWVLLQFATARIGAVLVNINPAYRPFELQYVLGQSDAVALFLVDQFKTSDYFAMLREVCPEIDTAADGKVSSPKYPRLRNIIAIKGAAPTGLMLWGSMVELGREVPDAELDRISVTLTPQQPINIQYTSGTTGFPKAAMLSHRNLLLNAYHVGGCQKFTADDRLCIPVPFYHCFGCVLGTLACAVYGTTMIIPAEYFQAGPTLDALEKEGATALYGVPTMYIAQLQDPSFASRRFTTLRTGIMSGAPCPIEVMRQVIDKLGPKELTIAYGQTEASPVITQTRTDDPLELRVETVGRPLPGVEVKIVDPATGGDLPENEQGELCTRGHVVMLGYYNNPEATNAAIDSDGWLHTGDLAIRLASGYYKITGRLKDMVIRGGENVYPREIEEFLFTHPAVEQAAVVGVPDPKYGEETCAWIKLKAGQTATADEIRSFCREKLAHFKVPKYVKFVDAFPQTVTGKIQKFKIRDAMKEELGLAEQKTA